MRVRISLPCASESLLPVRPKPLVSTGTRACHPPSPFVYLGDSKNNQVLALPRPSQCAIPGQLSVDLHLLRRAEALNVLEAVLHAIRRREQAVTHGRILHQRPPRVASSSQELHEALDYPESFAVAAATAVRSASPSSAIEGAMHGAELAEGGQSGGCVAGVERFRSLEVVVGRGAHSIAGVPRLRPCVAGYLAGKGFRADAVELHKGQGAIVVGLG